MNLKKLAYGQTADMELVDLYTLTSTSGRCGLDKMLWQAREFEGSIPPNPAHYNFVPELCIGYVQDIKN